ncbi:MAG: tetratricopeptide repeat protein [Pirellulales bacterium]
MSTVAEALSIAFSHHQRNELAQAEHLYRQILSVDPQHADAWHLLGLVEHQSGRHGDAARSIGRAIELNGAQAIYHNHLGAVHAALKDLPQAEVCFRQALAVNPADPQTHYNLGALMNLMGNRDGAIESYRRAVELEPHFAEAQFNLGNLLRDRGDLAQAETSYAAALAARPNYVKALSSLGAVQTQQGRFAETEPLWRRIIELDPRHVEAHYRLGSLLQQQGKLPEAVQSLQTAVMLDPHHHAAQNNLGCTYRGMGDWERAEQCFRLALSIKPDFVEGMVNLASLLHDKKEDDAAADMCRQALALQPDNLAAHNNLAAVHFARKEYDQALTHYTRVVELDPGSAEAVANVGATLHMQGRTDEAIEHFRRALEHDPRHERAHYCLGGALHMLGRDDEALASYDRAIAINPENAEAHYYRSFVSLSRGDLAQGWRDYEWRLRCKEFKIRRFDAPVWDGSPLAGRTLLILAEQGLGDTLHFIRYLQTLSDAGGKVMVEVPPALAPLLRASGVTGVIPGGTSLPQFDVYAPLMSLPGILGTTLETMPRKVPYLAADPRLLKHWRARLQPIEGAKVGIVWQGNPAYMFDHFRSIPLAEFAPLAEVAGVNLISLQKGTGSEQLAGIAGRFPVIDLGSGFDAEGGAFMDTAAVMCNLDLVVSSDTAAAHLAGGLGVPVWLALATNCEWRWMHDRDDCPWYPSMRLFRQSRAGDWSGVFARMRDELTQRIRQRTAHS